MFTTELNERLSSHGETNETHRILMPAVTEHESRLRKRETKFFNSDIEQKKCSDDAIRRYSMMNRKQRCVYNYVTNNIASKTGCVVFVNASGGTGKQYYKLYNTFSRT